MRAGTRVLVLVQYDCPWTMKSVRAFFRIAERQQYVQLFFRQVRSENEVVDAVVEIKPEGIISIGPHVGSMIYDYWPDFDYKERVYWEKLEADPEIPDQYKKDMKRNARRIEKIRRAGWEGFSAFHGGDRPTPPINQPIKRAVCECLNGYKVNRQGVIVKFPVRKTRDLRGKDWIVESHARYVEKEKLQGFE